MSRGISHSGSGNLTIRGGQVVTDDSTDADRAARDARRAERKQARAERRGAGGGGRVTITNSVIDGEYIGRRTS